MRSKSRHILILASIATTLAAAALPANAHARPHKPAPKPVARHAAAKTRPTKADLHHLAAHKPLAHAAKPTRAELRHAKAEARHQPKHAPVAVAHAEPAPTPEPTPQPEPHVKHNRKLHLTPTAEGDAQTPTDPQKATPADFLTTPPPPPAPTPVASVVVLPPPAPTDPSPSRPVPVISVLRHETPRPQVPTVEEIVETPVLMTALFDKRGHLIMPPAMKGSHDILIHQNVMADHDGLDRIQDDEDLDRMRENKSLVAIPQSAGLQVDDRLPASRRYTRPWTAQFLATLARAHYARFHEPLQVNSAVRTVEFQQRLIHTNGNAAPAAGETASPHLTGQAVDLAKHGLSMTEIAWMRSYLMPLVQQGKVDVEEEFQQACFHISVYKKYMPPAAPRHNPRHEGGTAMASAAMR